jgi:hypothetical protein
VKILNTSEPKDGYVMMDCEFEKEELEALLSYAITNILKDFIKNEKNHNKHNKKHKD